MATTAVQMRDMKYFFNKKGVISFVFSKFAFLVFGVIITAAFFGFLAVQTNIQELDRIYRHGELLRGVIALAESSPFNFSTTVIGPINGKIIFDRASFVIDSGGRNLSFKLIKKTEIVGNFESLCLNIVKTNSVKVEECP